MSNLKQIGLGTMMYVQDYDEKYPMIAKVDYEQTTCPSGVTCDNVWITRIYPYVKSVQLFACPSDTITPWNGGNTATNKASASTSYGANIRLLTAQGPVTSLAAIDKPSQTLMFADSGGNQRYALYEVYVSSGGSIYEVKDRHLEGANIAFADGHVKWKKMHHDADDHPVPPGPSSGVYWYPDGTH